MGRSFVCEQEGSLIIYYLQLRLASQMRSEINKSKCYRPISDKFEYPAEDYAAFAQMEYHQIIDLAYKDLKYAHSAAFFNHMTTTSLKNLLATVFHNKDVEIPKHQKQYILKMTTILKSSMSLLDFMEGEKSFNKKLVFGFLFSDPVPAVGVNIFADVFMTYARYAPDQTIKLFKEPELKEIMFRSIRFPPIYKVLFTTVFCLDRHSALQHPKFIPKCINQLLQTVFKDYEGVSLFQKTDKDTLQYMRSSQISEPHSPVRSTSQKDRLNRISKYNKDHCFFQRTSTKHERYLEDLIDTVGSVNHMIEQVFKNIQLIYQGNLVTLLELMLSGHYIRRIFVLLRLVLCSDYPAVQKNDCIYEVIKMCNLLLEKEGAISQTSPFFYSDKQFKYQVANHLRSSLDEKNSIDEQVQEMHDFQSEKNILISNRELPDLPQDVYLYRKISEYYTRPQLSQEEINCESEQNKVFGTVISTKLKLIAFSIAEQFRQFQIFQGEQNMPGKENRPKIRQSMNSQVQKVTEAYYEKVRLHLSILEFIQRNIYHNHKKHQWLFDRLDQLKVNTRNVIVPLIIKSLKISKWNNILHFMLVGLVRKYLSICFQIFVQEVVDIEHVSEGLLGLLVEMFRNATYVFISSARMTNFGDRQAVYTISRTITSEIVSHGDVKKLYKKFPVWKQFVTHDLEKYRMEHEFELASDDIPEITPQLVKCKSLDDSSLEHYLHETSFVEAAETSMESFHRMRRSSIDERSPLQGQRKVLDGNRQIIDIKSTRQMSAQDIRQKDNLRDFSLYYRVLNLRNQMKG